MNGFARMSGARQGPPAKSAAPASVGSHTASVRGREALAGLVLFAAAAQSMLVAMLAGAMAPGYSQGANAISDLGVIPQTATLFNASVIATGILTAIGGFLLASWLRRRWVVAFFVLAGAGAIGVGLAPVEISPRTHEWLALAAFLGFTLLPAACARNFVGWMRPISIVATVVGTGYLAVMVFGIRVDGTVFGDIGLGGAERMVIYPGLLWMLALGGYLMRTGDPR
ncbi:MAG: DUF998 domain-containing protein [Bauldia sp.]|nr:DUF998 domain-containing protein [Bauldia sp.]MCW5717623.1 DUF998 domain-containing protein [Bauldia sp.]